MRWRGQERGINHFIREKIVKASVIKCVPERERGEGGSIHWKTAELLGTYQSYIVLWFPEAKGQETRREKGLLAGKSRNAVKLPSTAVFRSSLWPPAYVTAFIAVLTCLWLGRGLWRLTLPVQGGAARARDTPTLGSGCLPCRTRVSVGLFGHRAPLALHLLKLPPSSAQGVLLQLPSDTGGFSRGSCVL